MLGPITTSLRDVSIALLVQFGLTFGVWIAAEAIGLSGILTMVAFAMTMARRNGPMMSARMRVPTFAVWESVVFVLNAFAFVLIGMQMRPIWDRLETGAARTDAVATAAAVLCATIAARFAWVFCHYVYRRSLHTVGEARLPKPTAGSSAVVAWAGMRGIVTLAAAFAVPETLPSGAPFPCRDLILLCSFAVVLGTLLLQGLTMAPLIRHMGLTDDDPVGRELRLGRTLAYGALIASIEGDETITAKLLRKEYSAVVEINSNRQSAALINDPSSQSLRRKALAVARQRAFDLRRDDVIGDDAFRLLVQEFDWAELSASGSRGE